MAQLITYTIIFTTVLTLVALGGMFSERSGIINLGLEGIMVIGALAGAVASSALSKVNAPGFLNVIISLLCAMAAGCLFSMLLGVACIRFKADQTITGTALNIMSTALAVVLARKYTGTTSSQIEYLPELYTIFSGKISIYIFLILMVVIVAISYIFLYKMNIKAKIK